MDTSQEFDHNHAWPPGYGPNGNQHPSQGAVPFTPNNLRSSLHTPLTEERAAASGSQHLHPPPVYNMTPRAPEHRAPPPFHQPVPPLPPVPPVPPFALGNTAREDAPSATSTPRTQPTGSSFLDDRYSSDELEFEPAAPKESASKQLKGKKRTTDPDTSAGKLSKKTKLATPSGTDIKSNVRRNASSGSKAQGGRQAGSSNYSDDDLKALFKFVREVLPIGQKAWQDVTERFNTWARENSRPRRECRPLKAKYDGLVRIASEKPTGSANTPWWVKRVLRIEDKISEKSHTKEFNDEDGAEPANNSDISGSDDGGGAAEELGDDEDEGAGGDGSDSEVVEIDSPASKARTAKGMKSGRGQPTLKAVHGQTGVSASRPARRGQARELLSAISASLDPAAREAREEKRFALRLLQEEVNRLTQENRDLRHRNEVLTDRTHELSLQLQEEKAEAKRLQSRIDTFEMMQSLVTRSQALALNPPFAFAPPPTNAAPSRWPPSEPPVPAMPMNHPYAPAPLRPPSTPHRNESEAGPSSLQQSDFMRRPSPVPGALDTLASVASGSSLGDAASSSDSASFTVTVSPSRRRYYRP